MVRKTKKIVDSTVVKALVPRDTDTHYLGDEPIFTLQPDSENRKLNLVQSFNWYNKFYGRKDAKDCLLQYLDLNTRVSEAKLVRKVDDNEFKITICWLARMSLRGLVLNEQESQTLNQEILRLTKLVSNTDKNKTPLLLEESEVSNKPNVQDIMREKAREAAGELEGILDNYVMSGAGNKFVVKAMDEVSKRNLLPQHINIITDIWKKKQKEFEDALLAKDVQIREAYRHLGKSQIKNLIKFSEQVLSDLNSYVSVKKANKAPRVRKAVPVEKIVSKLKYLKEFKDSNKKIELISISPVKLHGASECYLYDTAKRKLVYLCADDYSKTFSVKGTTILGFDSEKSQVKTLRKPETQLKEFNKLGKPAGRKYFEDIKTVSTTFNGRTNPNMIILRAW